MSGPVFGIIVGLIALAGVLASLSVLSSVYRRSGCFMRTLVIGLTIALFWTACIGFTTPRRIDGPTALFVIGITAVYIRRLWTDHTGDIFDFFKG